MARYSKLALAFGLCLWASPAFSQLVPSDRVLCRDTASPNPGQVEFCQLTQGLGFDGSKNITNTLTGDVDGAASANDLDEVAVEAELESVLDGPDLQGYGAGVATWLATPSSANLATAVTDETGSGALVFGTAPDLTISATTEGNIEAAIDTLANLTSVQGFTITYSDPNADAIFGWDDSAGAWEALSRAEVQAVIGDIVLGIETSGNYVATVADGTGIDGTASGEGSTYTPSLDLTEITEGPGIDLLATTISLDLTEITPGTGLDTGATSIDLDFTELGNITWGSGSGFAHTFDVGVTDPLFTFGSDQLGITNAKVAIGNTASLATWASSGTPYFQIIGTTADTSGFGNARFANSATAVPQNRFAKSRGTTIGDYTIVQNGDLLGTLRFEGADGTNFEEAARIDAYVDGTPGADDMPGGLAIRTTEDGTASSVVIWRFDSVGTLKPELNDFYDIGTAALGVNQAFINNIEFAGGTSNTLTCTGGACTVEGINVIRGSTGSTDNAMLRADGTGGSLAQSTGITIDDSNEISFPNTSASSTGLIKGLSLNASGLQRTMRWVNANAGGLTGMEWVGDGTGGTAGGIIAFGGTTYSGVAFATNRMLVYSNGPADGVAIGSDSAEPIVFGTSNAEIARFASTGTAFQPAVNSSMDLGTSDTLKFEDAYFDGTEVALDNNTALRLYETEANGDNYKGFISAAANTADTTCTFENDANFIPDSCVGDGTDASDGRLKNILGPAGDVGTLIDSIKIYNYEWTADAPEASEDVRKGKHGFGPVAQELISVNPDFVHVGGEDPIKDPWTWKPEKLVPYLIAEVQSLRRRVLELEGAR